MRKTDMHEELPACKRLLASLSEYVDGELDSTLCDTIEKHLADCENCQVVVNTLRKTVDLYHRLDADESVPVGVMQRLYVRLNLEDFLKQ